MTSSLVLPVSALVNDNNLHVDVGNLHTLNVEDDELGNEPGHEYLPMVDIEHNIEAEPEIHKTEVDDQNIETPNEGNGESVAVPGLDQHIDMERQEVVEQRSVNNSNVEEGPTNGYLEVRVKLGSKIGILATGTSLAGLLPSSIIQENDNNLHIDVGNLHMLNGEDDELGNEPGHEYLHMGDIEHNNEAEPEIHETEGDDQNIETSVEGNGESVAILGPDQHIDIENPEEDIVEQRSVNNSVVEESPTNVDLVARVKLGSKIGILAVSISLAGTIPIFNNLDNYYKKNLYDKLLMGGSLLSILASFVFGVILIQGCPFFHLEIFPMNNPKSIGKIKFVSRAAIISITMVMMFGFTFIIRRAY